jgi:hypothetical protein
MTRRIFILIEAVGSVETSIHMNQTTRRHILEIVWTERLEITYKVIILWTFSTLVTLKDTVVCIMGVFIFPQWLCVQMAVTPCSSGFSRHSGRITAYVVRVAESDHLRNIGINLYYAGRKLQKHHYVNVLETERSWLMWRVLRLRPARRH